MKSDQDQIKELMVRYGAAIDARDVELLRSCFTPDAVVCYIGFADELRGADALVGFLSEAVFKLDATHHMFMNFTIECDGQSGWFTCSVHAQHVLQRAPAGPLFTVGGAYRNEVIRTVDGWRMTQANLKPIWTSGNPEIVAQTPVPSAN